MRDPLRICYVLVQIIDVTSRLPIVDTYSTFHFFARFFGVVIVLDIVSLSISSYNYN